MPITATQNRPFYTRRFLQGAVALGGMVPVAAGLMGVLMGPGMVEDSGRWAVSMDSHYRYLSALLLGIGFGFWTTIPHIEKHAARFGLLSAIVVLGGLGRFYSLIATGAPDAPMLFGLGMELIVMPLLALWQRSVARSYAHQRA